MRKKKKKNETVVAKWARKYFYEAFIEPYQSIATKQIAKDILRYYKFLPPYAPPKSIDVVYRGVDDAVGRPIKGLSWTTSFKEACRFAGPNGAVYKLKKPKNIIWAEKSGYAHQQECTIDVGKQRCVKIEYTPMPGKGIAPLPEENIVIDFVDRTTQAQRLAECYSYSLLSKLAFERRR